MTILTVFIVVVSVSIISYHTLLRRSLVYFGAVHAREGGGEQHCTTTNNKFQATFVWGLFFFSHPSTTTTSFSSDFTPTNTISLLEEAWSASSSLSEEIAEKNFNSWDPSSSSLILFWKLPSSYLIHFLFGHEKKKYLKNLCRKQDWSGFYFQNNTLKKIVLSILKKEDDIFLPNLRRLFYIVCLQSLF